MSIDLDEGRVARREADKVPPTLIFGGKTYNLPVELPVEAVEALGDLAAATQRKDGAAIIASLRRTVKELLSAEDFAAFMENRPSANDLSAVVEGIPDEYGLTLPESPSLTEASDKSTARSKPRSVKRTG